LWQSPGQQIAWQINRLPAFRIHTDAFTSAPLLDCAAGGHHLNINVLQRETLIDAMEHPEKYPQVGQQWGGPAFV
jgi:autonomous glycyl radical cofactor GrcA